MKFKAKDKDPVDSKGGMIPSRISEAEEAQGYWDGQGYVHVADISINNVEKAFAQDSIGKQLEGEEKEALWRFKKGKFDEDHKVSPGVKMEDNMRRNTGN